MLRYNNQLLFPTLKLISIQNDSKNNLYQLDWVHIDTLKKEKWLKTQLTSDQFFPGTLPVFLKNWVDDMQFTIPQGLLDEIRHCSLKAEEEWGRRKPETRWEPIPTRGPAISYVQSAFTLLADCLFDPETNNFSRDGRKILVPYILIHRFWSYQTKPDNLMLYTGFQDLKKYYEDKQITDTYFLILEGLENHINLLQNKNEKVPPSIDYKKSESFVKRHNIKVIKDPNDWQSDETSVKKIDVNRIKEIRDNDLKANKDFKEIDIKSGLSNAENAVYLRHHK